MPTIVDIIVTKTNRKRYYSSSLFNNVLQEKTKFRMAADAKEQKATYGPFVFDGGDERLEAVYFDALVGRPHRKAKPVQIHDFSRWACDTANSSPLPAQIFELSKATIIRRINKNREGIRFFRYEFQNARIVAIRQICHQNHTHRLSCRNFLTKQANLHVRHINSNCRHLAVW
jgi:hypothetical protein